MNQELTPIPAEIRLVRPPDEVLAEATVAAKALKAVLEQKPDKVMMGGNQYLEYEDWQTVGQFYGYAVATHEAVPIELFGVKGFKATADLVDYRTGMIIGHAEAVCMRDEEKWGSRPKYEWRDDAETGERKRFQVGEEPVPWYQLASMAQTRAGAKAFRNRLAWVVVLAGFKPTPAEELPDDLPDRRKATGPSAQHWCKVHGVAFFKRGKMTGFAHLIKDHNGNDTGEWCHEGKVQAPPPAPTPTPKPGPTPAGIAEEWAAFRKICREKNVDDKLLALYIGREMALGLKEPNIPPEGISSDQIAALTAMVERKK